VTTVPVHGTKEIPKGLLRKMIGEDLELDFERFVRLYSWYEKRKQRPTNGLGPCWVHVKVGLWVECLNARLVENGSVDYALTIHGTAGRVLWM